MRFFHIVKQNRKPVEWSMNIQSKMKTRDAKNNPVTAVLVSVLVMFLLSCLFLLLLAALLYKFDLSESAVKVGIVVIYIVSGVIGGFFMGKIMKTQKFLWGFAAGAIYFCILFLIQCWLNRESPWNCRKWRQHLFYVRHPGWRAE